MPLYARHGVSYAWLVDPKAKTLEAFKLSEKNCWLPLGLFRDDDAVCVEPFDAITIDLKEY